MSQPTHAYNHANSLTAAPAVARVSPTGLVQFSLDLDIRLACEDQARAQGLDLGTWLQQTANDALRAYLGI